MSADQTRDQPLGVFRVRDLPPYLLGSVSGEVRRLRAEGREVIDLSQVNPDIHPPEEVLNTLMQACLRPENHKYSPTRGILKLRESLAAFYQRRFGVSLDPNSEICSTMATKEGLLVPCSRLQNQVEVFYFQCRATRFMQPVFF